MMLWNASGFVTDVLAQPTCWEAVQRQAPAIIPPLQQWLETHTPASTQPYIHCIGEGSSFHVASWIAHLGNSLALTSTSPSTTWCFQAHRPQALCHPSYMRQCLGEKDSVGCHLWVFVSQSGRTGVLQRVLAQLNACHEAFSHPDTSHGILILTNEADALLTRQAHEGVASSSKCKVVEWAYHAGKEQAIAATKTVSSSILAGTMLCQTLCDGHTKPGDTLPPKAPDVLSQLFQTLLTMAPSVTVASNVILLGHAHDECLLQEVGLKWLEMAGIQPLVLNTETFQHGYKALMTARPSLFGERSRPAVYVWLPHETLAREAVLQDLQHLSKQGVFSCPESPLSWEASLTPSLYAESQAHHGMTVIDGQHWQALCALISPTLPKEHPLGMLLWGQWMAEYFRIQCQAPPDALPGLEKVVG
ncbi:MAG: hypothetical protein ACKO37_10190 [Vampirovibrionales bacterium]